MLREYLERNDEYIKLEVRYNAVKSEIRFHIMVSLFLGILSIAFGVSIGYSGHSVVSTACPAASSRENDPTLPCILTVIVTTILSVASVIFGIILIFTMAEDEGYKKLQEKLSKIKEEFKKQVKKLIKVIFACGFKKMTLAPNLTGCL